MIGKITGRVDYIAEDHVLIEAAGIGYIVYCAQPTLARLPAPGEAAALYTELVVREDLLQLYGFPTLAEREWHRLLTSVQGVGAKVSLALLGTLGSDGVARALALGDAGAVKAAPGVGPKLASRIVNELSEKAPAVMALGARAGLGSGRASPPLASAASADGGSAAATSGVPLNKDITEDGPWRQAALADALSALVNLGYERGDAARAVAEADRQADQQTGEDPETAMLIRFALKRLAPSL